MNENENDIARAIDRTFAAYGAGDLDGFVAGFGQDVHYEDNVRPRPVIGRPAFRDYVAGWLDASSDGTITPVRKIIEGNQAAVLLHSECTHDRGPLFGVPASGRRIAFDFAVLADFEDGHIKRLQAFYNPLSIMQTLGLVGELPTEPR